MHVHISVKASKAKYDDARDWAMPGAAAPKTPSAPPPPLRVAKRPTLKLGAKGKDVRYLQKLLGVAIDGAFGPSTEAAVKKAQVTNKLFADGVVGAYTWAAIMK